MLTAKAVAGEAFELAAVILQLAYPRLSSHNRRQMNRCEGNQQWLQEKPT
ncbi:MULTISPECIES: hypothetical protein [unclassified Paenibacillus]|nr:MULTISPECIES: hypothetical protein [unclassified Paenibacillus]